MFTPATLPKVTQRKQLTWKPISPRRCSESKSQQGLSYQYHKRNRPSSPISFQAMAEQFASSQLIIDRAARQRHSKWTLLDTANNSGNSISVFHGGKRQKRSIT